MFTGIEALGKPGMAEMPQESDQETEQGRVWVERRGQAGEQSPGSAVVVPGQDPMASVIIG